MKTLTAVIALALGTSSALAAPVTYEIDPSHTYPSFTADHMGGLSKWRGKINRNSGKIVLDSAAQTGTVTMEMDMASIDFGHDGMNKHARSADIFYVERFPTATYTGTLTGFKDGKPTAVDGKLTLQGVTHPLKLSIDSFLCKNDPMRKKEVCGANATARFKRDDYGVDFGKDFGFDMTVTLDIQVEALRAD